MPDTGVRSTMGIARAPITAPSSAPEPVISYTTQPSAACWIHWLHQESSDPLHSRRKPRYASGEATRRRRPSALAPRGGRAPAHGRVVARHHPYIDHAYRAVLHAVDAFLDRGMQLFQARHRADAHGALRARHRREVDVGLVDALPDPLVFHRPAALARDALLVHLVVVEGTV